MSQGDREELLALAALRAMRAERAMAGPLREVAAIRAQLDALRAPVRRSTSGDLAEAAIRDRHEGWRREQILRLSQSLARAEAKTQPGREALARARGREAALRRAVESAARRQMD